MNCEFGKYIHSRFVGHGTRHSQSPYTESVSESVGQMVTHESVLKTFGVQQIDSKV